MTPRILTLSVYSMLVPRNCSVVLGVLSFFWEKCTNPVFTASKIDPLSFDHCSARGMTSSYSLSVASAVSGAVTHIVKSLMNPIDPSFLPVLPSTRLAL